MDGSIADVLWHAPSGCPAWCTTAHGLHRGEEDWVHLSEPIPLSDGVSAQLCMSIEPATGVEDGPYLVIGSTEYTLPEGRALGASLMAMAAIGAGATSPSVV